MEATNYTMVIVDAKVPEREAFRESVGVGVDVGVDVGVSMTSTVVYSKPRRERIMEAGKRIADGVYLVGRYSPYQVGAWVLSHRGEAALLEMPPGQAGFPKPWVECQRFCKKEGLTVRWLLLSHGHIDHTFGFPEYRRRFRDARLLVHRSFLDWYRRDLFDEVFSTTYREISLGGEPLILLHAPKHSPQDTLVIFRGTVCTGDWSLGRHPDCNPLITSREKVQSLDLVERFLDERDYRIHLAYSAHGNEIRRDIDFRAFVADMKDYWQHAPRPVWRKAWKRVQRRKWLADED